MSDEEQSLLKASKDDSVITEKGFLMSKHYWILFFLAYLRLGPASL